MSGKPLSPRQQNSGRLPRKNKNHKPQRDDEPGDGGKNRRQSPKR